LSKSLSVFLSSTVNGESSTLVQHKYISHVASETSATIKKDVRVGESNRTCSFGYSIVSDKKTDLIRLTSVKPEIFELLLALIPEEPIRCNTIQPQDKLLICLLKLKLGISFGAISAFFNCHYSTVSKIFSLTLQTLCEKTRSWLFWPSKDAVQETMPDCFRMLYPSCRVIIDCSEVKTERPSTITQQNLLFSHYKSDFTIKFLVGITPAGFISFCSKAYGGRSSDTFITTDSGLLALLEPGDLCMADKGFPQIRNNLEDNNVILVMPPFSDPKIPQFSEADMEETYKVASVRIHVERVIQRIKICNILNSKLTNELMPHVDNILHLCCILANLQNPIIK